MIRILVLFSIALAAFGAEDQWTKVMDLKSGAELRIYKKDAKQPVLAKMDEANADSLLVVVKNEQVSIPKDQIDRIDARPKTGRIVRHNESTIKDPNTAIPSPTRPEPARVPTASTSSGVNFGSKPDFETVYRRSPGK